MLAAFLEHPFFLNCHRQAPLLKERESFLSHLQQQGTSRKALRNLSAELLQEVRLLKLTEMRDVSLEEIRRAARCWAHQATHESKGTVLRQLCFILQQRCTNAAQREFSSMALCSYATGQPQTRVMTVLTGLMRTKRIPRLQSIGFSSIWFHGVA